jgi:hypothetical protein
VRADASEERTSLEVHDRFTALLSELLKTDWEDEDPELDALVRPPADGHAPAAPQLVSEVACERSLDDDARWDGAGDHDGEGATSAVAPGRSRRSPVDPAADAVGTAGSIMGAAASRLASTPGSALAEAVALLDRTATLLTSVDLADEHVDAIGDATLAVQAIRTRLDVAMLDLVAAFDGRDGHCLDGAASTATWLKHRTNLDHGQATTLATTARRIRMLPVLARHLAAGDTSYQHAATITRAMTGTRIAAIGAAERTLTRLAMDGSTGQLRHAIKRLRDLTDPDGTPAPDDGDAAGDPADGDGPVDPGHAVGAHPDRELHLSESFDGLGLLDATLDPYVRESLQVLLDAFHTADPADTPPEERRSPAQARHDAFAAMLDTLLRADGVPTVQGRRPHVLLTVDLTGLLGLPVGHPLAPTALAVLAQAVGVHLPGITDDAELVAPELRRQLAAELQALHGDPGVDGPRAEDAGSGACRVGTTARPGGGSAVTVTPPASRDGADRGSGLGPKSPALGDEREGRPAGAPPTPVPASTAPAPSPPPAPPRATDPTGLHRPPRFGSGTPVPIAHVRELLLTAATIQTVLTLGPWRPVNVGSTHRTLPAWLRTVLIAMHEHCRGPDCDRPAAWTDAHHNERPWAGSRETDLNDTLPLCGFHHDLVTSKGWRVRLDRATGACTWTSPSGRTVTTRPPQPPRR